jgi:hypothetical protein
MKATKKELTLGDGPDKTRITITRVRKNKPNRNVTIRYCLDLVNGLLGGKFVMVIEAQVFANWAL